MSEKTTTSLIVVLQSSNTDVEKNGQIINFGSGASIDTVRNLAMDKLGIAKNIPLGDIILRDASGKMLDGIDQVRQQQVIYLDLKEHVKEVIPGPFKYPFVGSIRELLPNMTLGWVRMFDTYGPVVNMNLMGEEIVGTNDPAVAELFVKESEYFTKKLSGGLKEIKAFGGQGLFTTNTDDEDWKLAHKLLMPAFSPRAIKAYLHEMGVISLQTIKTLEQYDPSEKVEILDWTTRLTFETIGRCGFGYDFGLLESKDTPNHPFIDAMSFCLKHAVARLQQMSFVKHLPLEQNRHFDRSVQLMNDTVDQVIKERKSGPDANDIQKDLLGFMLNARDEHQLGLSDENIRYQVVTFLIAGHDTTANTLAWTLYELSRNPHVEAKLLQEIANVGITHDKIPTIEQVSELKYTHQVLKETLRKYPPVRALGKYCKKDCVIPGGYLVKANTPVSVNLFAMHRNPKVYPDPLRYDPERFSPEEEQKRSRFSWLPFSTGPRACIGMAFALQEAKVVLAMLLHRFKFHYDGPDVEFDPMMATTKPTDFFVNIQPRTDFPEPNATPIPTKTAQDDEADKPKATIPHFESIAEQMAARPAAELPPVTFLYGTQTGTAQDYASVLASQARSFGFKQVTLCEMDKWNVLDAGKYQPKESGPQELVVICTATYNGQPPDSAERFSNFITEKLKEEGHENLLKSLQFAVFGVGNKNWRTYQVFPRKVNETLEQFGAERFFGCGEGNADKDMDADFNEWSAHFWVHALSSFGLSLAENQSVVPSASRGMETQQVNINFISPMDEDKWKQGAINRNGSYNVEILRNRELQQPASDRSTRHIELDISALKPLCKDGQLYMAGDHLEVFPENHPDIVEAIGVNFGWVLDSVFEIDHESLGNVSPRSLAASIHGPCSIRNALTYYADLSSPPTRTMLSIFAEQLSSTSTETAEAFRKLIMPDSPEYASFIEKHRTILDLQKHYPQVKRLDLGQFLAAVGVMQPRRYSIASSPLAHPQQAHLTIGVVHDKLKDGREYYGLASSYLGRSHESITLRAALKSSKSTFSLPTDPATPIIMIAAGTGVSPFRGFLQERAFQHANSDGNVGECVLFFGCRRQDQDYIYADEMQEYVNSGVIKGLHVAFSRQGQPIKYVQHQLLENAIQVWKLLQANASIYVCGAGTMSRDVRRAFCTMAKSFGQVSTEEEADAFVQDLIDQGRYNEDVWG
ncbi:cytochrome P450 [Lichtheimia hyalospora FSU 10163]|nr:cytochrome P450 [Lichtheimia hyalospora FSU 10163]